MTSVVGTLHVGKYMRSRYTFHSFIQILSLFYTDFAAFLYRFCRYFMPLLSPTWSTSLFCADFVAFLCHFCRQLGVNSNLYHFCCQVGVNSNLCHICRQLGVSCYFIRSCVNFVSLSFVNFISLSCVNSVSLSCFNLKTVHASSSTGSPASRRTRSSASSSTASPSSRRTSSGMLGSKKNRHCKRLDRFRVRGWIGTQFTN